MRKAIPKTRALMSLMDGPLQEGCKALRKLNQNFITNQKWKQGYHGLMRKSKLTAYLRGLVGLC